MPLSTQPHFTPANTPPAPALDDAEASEPVQACIQWRSAGVEGSAAALLENERSFVLSVVCI